MNRPPFKRYQKSRKQQNPTANELLRGWRKLPRAARTVVLLLLGLSCYQYLSLGEIRWPATVYDQLTGTVTEYGTRPEAGWRKATDALEKMGANREGTPLPEFDLNGRVVRVGDGDTLSLLDRHNRQHKIRFFGIDTPELAQPHGPEARAALASLVNGKSLGVVVIDTDDYGRVVGTVYADQTNVNLALVRGGHAWWYRHFAPHERLLAAAESEARKQRLGLWAQTDPEPPWQWRRSHRRQ